MAPEPDDRHDAIVAALAENRISVKELMRGIERLEENFRQVGIALTDHTKEDARTFAALIDRINDLKVVIAYWSGGVLVAATVFGWLIKLVT